MKIIIRNLVICTDFDPEGLSYFYEREIISISHLLLRRA